MIAMAFEFQIHDVEFCASVDQLVNHTLPTLQKFKREGKAKYIGITGYTPKILKKIIERAPPGSVDVILSYCRMNLLNQGPVNNSHPRYDEYQPQSAKVLACLENGLSKQFQRYLQLKH